MSLAKLLAKSNCGIFHFVQNDTTDVCFCLFSDVCKASPSRGRFGGGLLLYKIHTTLDELDGKCLEQSLAIRESCEDFDIIDESGKYELTLPYGEYYILFISKNRERPTVTELTGRKIVKKIKVDKPATLLSIEFGY